MKLFKFITLSVLFTLVLYPIYGQNLALGARTGATYFTLDNEELNADAAYQLGVDVALVSEWRFSPVFSFQPELHYTQKGVAFDYEAEGMTQSMHFKTAYLELPLLLKARYQSGSCEVYGFLAPSVGYAVDRFVNIKMGDEDSTKEDIDFIDEGVAQDQRWEFSALGGIGAGIAAGPGQIVLDIRYSYGLTDDTKFESDKPNDWTTTKTRGCTISVGYMVPLGR